jgi:hypothetical protein
MNEYVYIRSGLFTVSCNKQISCPPSRWVSQGTLVSSTNKKGGNNKLTELRAILQWEVKTHKYINRQNQSTTGKL